MLIVAAGLLAAGCGSDSENDDTKLTGTVTADGSSTVFPIAQAVAEEFRSEQPDVEVSVGTSGTGGGFEKFCAGETDIATASRPIKDEEAAACETGSVAYAELPIATDGLSVVVHPDNDWVDCLTLEQLAAVWGPDSTMKRWNEIDPAFPDEPLALYGPGTDSGTFDYFTEQVNGEEGASRSDYTASEDDNVLVQGVAGDENALGYFGHGYVEENPDKVRAVEVDGGDGCVEPTTETITDGTYAPLSRPLFMYVAEESATKEEVAAFVEFSLDNVQELAGDVGFVAASDEMVDEARTAWDEIAAGDESEDDGEA